MAINLTLEILSPDNSFTAARDYGSYAREFPSTSNNISRVKAYRFQKELQQRDDRFLHSILPRLSCNLDP